MKRLLVFFIVLSLILSLCGCSALLERADDPQVRANTKTVLDAMLTNDLQAALHLFSPAIPTQDVAQLFIRAQTYLPSTDDYELTLLNIRSTTNFNGSGDSSKTIAAVYELTFAEQRFITEVEQYEGTFQYFWITPYEETDYYSYGGINNMDGATPLQWVLLLSNLLWIALTVILLIDCCRHKTRQKLLWILLLLFGMVAFYLNSSASSSQIGFTFGSFAAYTALIRYGSGAMSLRVLFPVTAIIYLCLRKRLHRPKPVPQPYPQMPQTPPTPPEAPMPPESPQ